MSKFIILVTMILLSGCVSDKKEALQFLKSKNYTNIKIGGYAYTCLKSHPIRTSFKATNEKGETVYGAVCSSFFFPTYIYKK